MGPKPKNEIHRMGKSMKKKLLEIVQVTKKNSILAKSEKKDMVGPNNMHFLHYFKNWSKSRLLGHNYFIFQISSK